MAAAIDNTDLLKTIARIFAPAIAEELRAASRPTWVDQMTVEKVTGVARKTYVQASRAGELPSRRVGHKILARVADVERWIEAQPAAGERKRARRSADDQAIAEERAAIAREQTKITAASRARTTRRGGR